MSDKKLTDEEIIKALEDYIKESEFEYFHSNMVGEYPLIRKSLDLINRQKAENLKLRLKVNELLAYKQGVTKNNIKNYEEYTAQKSKIENLQNVISNQQIEISAKIEKQIKSEAYKEFTEKLKEEFLILQYNAKTDRKNVKIEELKEQMDWLLHTVAIETVENLLKEMVGEEE